MSLRNRFSDAQLHTGRASPAVAFDELHNKLIVFGGTTVDGQLLHSVEIIQLEHDGKTETSIFELGLHLAIPYSPSLSTLEVFMQKESCGICIVHTRNKASEMKNDINS